jgi:hypothetical protein
MKTWLLSTLEMRTHFPSDEDLMFEIGILSS